MNTMKEACAYNVRLVSQKQSILRKMRVLGSVNMHEVLYGIEKYSKDSHLVLQIPTLEYNKNDSELSIFLELYAERKGEQFQGWMRLWHQ